MKKIFHPLISLLLLISTSSYASSMQDLFPVRSGTVWNYSSSQGNISTTILDQKQTVNGVETTVFADSDGYREFYTNDENGLRLHKTEEPVDTGTGTIVFNPPIKLIEQFAVVGNRLSLQGIATMTYPGLGVFTLNYTINSHIVGLEDISTPAGIYNQALHLNYVLTISGNVAGSPFSTTGTSDQWLVEGTGAVRFDSNDGSEYSTAGLVNVMIPQSTPPKILWRHAISGNNEYYFMNGASITSFGAVNTLTDLDWVITGTGDFNANGEKDTLWRNSQTGENRIDFMNGMQVDHSATVNTVPDTRWEVVGIADFNGDGKDDILWRHNENGRVWMYLMDQETIIGSHHIAFTALNWEIKEAADFDGDGRGDILWRNKVHGRVWLYLMNGELIHTNQHVAFSGADWDIKGTGDFNGDGREDIIWRQDATGVNWMYLMNGTQIIQNDYVNTLPDLNWNVGLTQDFNGDGRTDILWRHAVTGENMLYQMNGKYIMGASPVHQVSDLNWKIAN